MYVAGMNTRSCCLVVVALSGCGSAPARSPAPSEGRLARLGDLVAPSCPAAGVERIALRGTSVAEVESAYGVPVRGDGVTDLVGDPRTPTTPSLSVEAAGGRVVRVTLAVPSPASSDECDLAAAAQRRFGEPGHGACSSECTWPRDGVRLAQMKTRTVNYLEIHLEADDSSCGPGGTPDRAPVDESPESMHDCPFWFDRPPGGDTAYCCYARREDACAAAGCAPDACVTDGGFMGSRPRCETAESASR
jgi:hypothetical protein